MVSREKIARIIAPEAFDNWFRYYLVRKNCDMLTPEQAARAAEYQYGDDLKEAYEKADSVLAVVTSGEGGGDVSS